MKRAWPILFEIVFLVCWVSANAEESPAEILEGLLESYDRNDPPSVSAGKPTEVQVGVYISSLTVASPQDMKFTIGFYMRHSWQDSRLAFTSKDVTSIKVHTHLIESIWRPDLFFRNEIGESAPDVAHHNTFLKVNSTGHIWFVERRAATFYCPMKFQRFPFDTQACGILIESFGYSKDTFHLGWLRSPVDIDVEIQIPEYAMTGTLMYDCSQNVTSGSYPCLEIRLFLAREIGVYVLRYFLPITLVVIMSWIALWMRAEAAGMRLLYGLIAYLIMATCVWNTPIPTVSYAKAIDIWTIVCSLFLFGVLLESAVVSFLSRRSTAGATAGRYVKQDEGMTIEEPTYANNVVAERVDFFARIVFPGVFLFFVIVYASVYN